jgi:hypothetical protein
VYGEPRNAVAGVEGRSFLRRMDPEAIRGRDAVGAPGQREIVRPIFDTPNNSCGKLVTVFAF